MNRFKERKKKVQHPKRYHYPWEVVVYLYWGFTEVCRQYIIYLLQNQQGSNEKERVGREGGDPRPTTYHLPHLQRTINTYICREVLQNQEALMFFWVSSYNKRNFCLLALSIAMWGVWPGLWLWMYYMKPKLKISLGRMRSCGNPFLSYGVREREGGCGIYGSNLGGRGVKVY